LRATPDQHEWSRFHKQEQCGVLVELAQHPPQTRFTEGSKLQFYYRGASRNRRLQHLKHMETMMRPQKTKGIYDMPYTMHFG
jgi:hypothetical protein